VPGRWAIANADLAALEHELEQLAPAQGAQYEKQIPKRKVLPANLRLGS